MELHDQETYRKSVHPVANKAVRGSRLAAQHVALYPFSHPLVAPAKEKAETNVSHLTGIRRSTKTFVVGRMDLEGCSRPNVLLTSPRTMKSRAVAMPSVNEDLPRG